MTCSRLCLALLASLTLVCPALADTQLFGGRPRLGFELESERAADHHGRGQSFTLTPGLRWDDGLINVAELIWISEREHDLDSGERERRQRFGLRLRKDFALGPDWTHSWRVFAGRARSAEANFDYAYIEPGLRWQTGSVEWGAGYRLIRRIAGEGGHHSNELRLGPGFELSERDEIEFRWVRAWEAGSRRHLADSLSLEYTRKF